VAADTPNLSLKRPDLADYFHLANHLNGNWDKIDAYIGAAKGSKDSIDQRLDISLNEDGTLKAGGVPTGVIVMWSGLLSAIPGGWSLCDGGDSRPDLREKFILGWSNGVDPGGTGGANSITLAITNLPAHTHGVGTLVTANNGSHTHGVGSLVTNNTGAHTHTVPNCFEKIWAASGSDQRTPWNGHYVNSGSSGAHTHTITGSTASGGAHTHTITGSTASVGSGTSFDNRPAFYKLAFIIKT
jgi:hypothetical protein